MTQITKKVINTYSTYKNSPIGKKPLKIPHEKIISMPNQGSFPNLETKTSHPHLASKFLIPLPPYPRLDSFRAGNPRTDPLRRATSLTRAKYSRTIDHFAFSNLISVNNPFRIRNHTFNACLAIQNIPYPLVLLPNFIHLNNKFFISNALVSNHLF